MYIDDRERPAPGASVTAAGVDHVRLWYHYLDIGDLDAYGSLLDEHAQVSRPDAPPGHGRAEVLERQAALSRATAEHHIYKIIAADDAVAVMGRYLSPSRAAPERDGGGKEEGKDDGDGDHVEFADFFTLTDKGLLLSCRRYYFVAPEQQDGRAA
jgi:hypothetical protein